MWSLSLSCHPSASTSLWRSNISGRLSSALWRLFSSSIDISQFQLHFGGYIVRTVLQSYHSNEVTLISLTVLHFDSHNMVSTPHSENTVTGITFFCFWRGWQSCGFAFYILTGKRHRRSKGYGWQRSQQQALSVYQELVTVSYVSVLPEVAGTNSLLSVGP